MSSTSSDTSSVYPFWDPILYPEPTVSNFNVYNLKELFELYNKIMDLIITRLVGVSGAYRALGINIGFNNFGAQNKIKLFTPIILSNYEFNGDDARSLLSKMKYNIETLYSLYNKIIGLNKNLSDYIKIYNTHLNKFS